MRRPRMTTLRWMIAVVVVVLLIYGGIGGALLWRRHNYFLSRAEDYAEQLPLLRSLREQVISESNRVDPRDDRRLAQFENVKAMIAASLEYAAEMASKYCRKRIGRILIREDFGWVSRLRETRGGDNDRPRL